MAEIASTGRQDQGCRVAVLVSGSGTIAKALIDSGLPVVVLVADRRCAAEVVAARAGVDFVLVERTDFTSDFDRDAYSADLVAALAPWRVDVLAMAGFGTILGAAVHDAYTGRIVNTHPALLPAFKGWHAVADALKAGVVETGCTVHLASLAVDDGPILAQATVPVLPGDTVEDLHERIKSVERRLYPEALRRFLGDLEITK